MLIRTIIALATVTLILNAAVFWLVASGEGRLLTLLIYLAALGTGIAAILSARTSVPATGTSRPCVSAPWLQRGDLPLLVAVMAVQVFGLIYMSTFPFHYVQDEFITGYTSYTLSSITEIEWFAGYPAPGEWIAGFPILYYALQWPFIELFGLSLETIRISTWPYHLLSAALVYLIGKEFFRCQPWAVVAAMVYIMLAPNLYMAGYGMHNISSTFFFLAAFYAAIRMIREDSRIWAIVCGLFATMAYLTYTSSYLTLPLLALMIGLWALFTRSRLPLLRFGQALIIVAIGLLPFLTHAFSHHNYFTERGDQVNATSSFYGEDGADEPTSAMLDHVWTNIQSLYTPGIGGVTDYWFGHRALFDWLTLALLAAGLIIGLTQGIRDRDALRLSVVATVAATFAFGMFLTLPAGGFHRTSLAFPFVALLIALTMRAIIEYLPEHNPWPRIRAAVTGLLLLVVILINVSMLESMTENDEQISGLTDSVPMTSYIEERLPDGSEILISAFPNYHLERELIVRTGNAYDVRIVPFDEAVERGDDTLIILFQPSSDQTHRLEARYAGGDFVDSYDGRVFRRHLIWEPEAGSE
jgi:4-amino-4-deoxy-L-arabinose transferase-like glycosyltransferase